MYDRPVRNCTGLHTRVATIIRLPSGSWRAQVMRGGTRHGQTFTRKSDAVAWAKLTETKLDSIRASGSAPPPKGATFADFVDKYVEETDPIKPHGKNKKATLIRLKAEFASVLMSNFSTIHIRDFVSKRLKDKNGAGARISGVTIGVDLSYISTILFWARDVKHYDLKAEMANDVRKGLSLTGVSTRSNEREREMTPSEHSAITEEYVRKGGRLTIPMPTIISFALETAMRQEEICSITIEDIDFEGRTVIIRNRKHPKKKIGNDQTVPLLDPAWDILTSAIGVRKKGRIFDVNPRSVSASFTRVCKKCNIEDLHFHDLRHTAISKLFREGMAIQEVAILSGHRDWAQLKRYTHIKPKDVLERHRALAAAKKLQKD